MSWFEKILCPCFSPRDPYRHYEEDLLWSRDLENHSCGTFSFAVIQANNAIEDKSQVEVASNAIFVGVYDGHGADTASNFVNNRLFGNFVRHLEENGFVTEVTLRSAISDTETAFRNVVRMGYEISPVIAAAGSCCLIAVIWKGILYIANLGDSRAVMGSVVEGSGGRRSHKIVAEQLTPEHNAKHVEIRNELHSAHPDDPEVVQFKHGTWLVKGIIQISRAIGDVYLKLPGYALGPAHKRFHLADPITEPVISSEPWLTTRALQASDRFLIFASDGLWEHVSNEEAVQLVEKHPHKGIAKRLIVVALIRAAAAKSMKLQDLRGVGKGPDRRNIHDDITVVVVFLNHELLGHKVTTTELSYKGCNDIKLPSDFARVDQFM